MHCQSRTGTVLCGYCIELSSPPPRLTFTTTQHLPILNLFKPNNTFSIIPHHTAPPHRFGEKGKLFIPLPSQPVTSKMVKARKSRVVSDSEMVDEIAAKAIKHTKYETDDNADISMNVCSLFCSLRIFVRCGCPKTGVKSANKRDYDFRMRIMYVLSTN